MSVSAVIETEHCTFIPTRPNSFWHSSMRRIDTSNCPDFRPPRVCANSSCPVRYLRIFSPACGLSMVQTRGTWGLPSCIRLVVW